MKFSLLKFWMSFFNFGIVGDEGGGGTGDDSTGTGDDKGGDDGKSSDGGKGAGDDGKGAGDDGKGKPSDAEAALLKEVMTRKKAQKEAQDKLNELSEKLKQYEGLDVDKVRALLKEKEDAETDQLAKQGEWERLKARMAEEHTKSLTKVTEDLNALQGQLAAREQLVFELTIGNDFATSKFVSEELTLTPSKARIVYGEHFQVEDGKTVGYDKPKSASNRTPLVDASGEPLSFELALKKIIDADPDKDSLIRSKIKPGSDSSTQGKAKPIDLAKAELTGVSRISAGLKKASGK